MMDMLSTFIGGMLMLIGIIGCLLPLLPGPPISYVGLLLLQLRSDPTYTSEFMWWWAAIVLLLFILDYLIPIYGTKRFGGTKYGLWGCVVGLIAGFWFGPVGIVAGPFFGALLGEWIGCRNSNQAMKAAIGSFVGFLLGTVIKLVASVVMLYYFITAL